MSLAVLFQGANLLAAVHLYVLPAAPSDHTHLAQSMASPPLAAGPWFEPTCGERTGQWRGGGALGATV